MKKSLKLAFYAAFISFVTMNTLQAIDPNIISEDVTNAQVKTTLKVTEQDETKDASSKGATFDTKEILGTAAKAAYKSFSLDELKKVASKTYQNIKDDFEEIKAQGKGFFSKVFSVVKNIASGIIEYVGPIVKNIIKEVGPVVLKAAATFAIQAIIIAV